MKNDELFKKVLQRPIRDQIRERQLKFMGNCLRMNKEDYILYKSDIRSNYRVTANFYNYNQISTYLANDANVKLEIH